jgi:hypothetical protein
LQDGRLNRKQRKELAQRLAKDDPGLEIVHRDAGRTIQQMQKALTKMNVHLANAINDVSGVTGLRIIRAIVSGQRDPRQLAKLRDVRVRASEEEIVCSLEGNWQSDVLFELEQALETYDFHQKQLAACDAQLQRYI